MADNKMQIILEMIDKASPEFKKANASVIQEVKKLETESTKSGKNVEQGLKKAGQELRNLRTQILPIVAIIGTMVVTTKEWAKTNANTATAFNDLGTAAKGFSSNIGSLLAPSITGLSELVKKSAKDITSFFDGVRSAYASLFDSITYATQYIVAFGEAVKARQGIMEAHAIATDVASAAVKEMGTKFRETMTEVEYGYSLLQQAEKNLSELRLMLSDEESLKKRVSVDEDIALLKYYEQTYRTAHSGMAALTVALGKSVQTNLSGAITNMVTGVTSAKEAMTQLGQAMVKTIVDFMAQKLVAAVLEKTLLAGTVAATSAAAATIASAWAPGAFLATVATLGTAAAQAPASLAASGAASMAIMTGLSAGKGVVGAGAGSAGTIGSGTIEGSRQVRVDNWYPQAEGGDYMVNKPTLFMAGEAGPERATFTPIGGGRGSSFGDVNIFIQGGINPRGSSVEEMAEQLGFAFERETRLARGF